MSTLLMRFAAPMQSWGADAKFRYRHTERAPTKSGVIGLVAAALGVRRNQGQRIAELQNLRFGVRVDKEGALLQDYHTAGDSDYVTHRYYLADAIFLVGLEGRDELLQDIEYALCFPAFPLYLGRRSCPPEGSICLGIRTNLALLQALREEPWLVSDWAQKYQPSQVRLKMIADAKPDDQMHVHFQRDVPLSFGQQHRKFGFRRVFKPSSIKISNLNSRHSLTTMETEHDPMKDL